MLSDLAKEYECRVSNDRAWIGFKSTSVLKICKERKRDSAYIREIQSAIFFVKLMNVNVIPFAVKIYEHGLSHETKFKRIEVNEKEQMYYIKSSRATMDFTKFIRDFQNTDHFVSSILFQVAFILYTLHNAIQFVHGDLHSSNVFIQELPEVRILEYLIGDQKYRIRTRYIATLYDMQFSSSSLTNTEVLNMRDSRKHDFCYLLKRISSPGKRGRRLLHHPSSVNFAKKYRKTATYDTQYLETILTDSYFDIFKLNDTTALTTIPYRLCQSLTKVEN